MKNPMNFDAFVIFADMRTGSNFLEENLNSVKGVHSYGEAFNPHFIGKPKATKLFGVSMQEREKTPTILLDRFKEKTDGIGGFRFFHDHDPRVMAHCLQDEKCAKIILSRNPIETYVSREIARETGQWRLGDSKRARSAQIKFDEQQFKKHLSERQEYRLALQNTLQCSGQTAFYLDYEDIQNVDVLNGLLRFLGVQETVDRISRKTKKQNPSQLQDKVTNFEEMEKGLAGADYFQLGRIPNFEPRRGPSVPKFVAAAQVPILFMPVMGSASNSVIDWLATIDGETEKTLLRNFTQKSLRQWKRKQKLHRSFTVIRHPVARLHSVFVDRILMPGPRCYTEIRNTLNENYKLNLPDEPNDSNYAAEAHSAAFIKFASFVKSNLNAQTGIRTDGAWASQVEVLNGFSKFALPDFVFREHELERDLDVLASSVGITAPAFVQSAPMGPVSLELIYDDEVEASVRAAYQKDYMMFGFTRWKE